MGHINKSSVPQGADTQQGGRTSPYDPDCSVENHLREPAAGSNNQTQSAQAPTPNTINNNNPIPFQNSQKRVTNATGPTGQRGNKYSQPSNKGPGKKASSHINTQPSVSDIFAQTSAYPQSRNLGTGRPKLFCTACGEYDHWRKDCPLRLSLWQPVTATHMLPHMCRAPPKPSPTPSPQPVICIYCEVVQSISRWIAETVLETTERKVAYPVQHPVGTPETDNENRLQHIVQAHKNPISGPEVATNHRDLRWPDNTSQQPQRPTQGKTNNNNNFLTGIIGTVSNWDKHDSTKGRIKRILHITLPLPLHYLQAPTYLVILLCGLRKCNLIPLRFLRPNKNLK